MSARTSSAWCVLACSQPRKAASPWLSASAGGQRAQWKGARELKRAPLFRLKSVGGAPSNRLGANGAAAAAGSSAPAAPPSGRKRELSRMRDMKAGRSCEEAGKRAR